MKKFLVVIAHLSLLCPLVATAATTSAKSGNCTVNTCELELTAEANPYGILLKWNFNESGFSAKITRDDKWFSVYTVASNGSYLDQSAEYMKRYEYKIEILGDSGSSKLTATTYAIRGTGMAPSISNVEVAPLWLVDKGPYNVRITLNSVYDVNRYEVTEIGFSIKIGNDKKQEWFSYDRSGIYNLYPKFVISDPGEYEVTAQCKYKERTAQNATPIKGDECKDKPKAKVFFHKYGENCRSEDWKKYWARKALPCLKEFDLENFSGSERGYSLCRYGYHLVKSYKLYPEIYKYDEMPTFKKLQIDPRGVETFGPSYGIGLVGSGIGAAAIITSHELYHQATTKKLRSGRYLPLRILSDREMEELEAESKVHAQAQMYLTELKKAYSDKDNWAWDEDGDGVWDKEEHNLGCEPTDPDTHNGLSDYEYVASKHESLEGPSGSNVKKDYAFPGSKIAQDCQGCSKNSWRAVKDIYQERLSGFGRSAKQSLRLLGSTKDDDDNANDFYVRVNEIPDVDFASATSEVTIKTHMGVGREVDGGFLDGMVYNVRIDATGLPEEEIIVDGFLVDENSRPVAKVSKAISLKNSAVVDCAFYFPAADIYRGKHSGFTLECLTVSVLREGKLVLLAGCLDAAESDRKYEYSEFVPNSAYLNGNNILCEKVDGKLMLSCEVEIVSNGAYEISADLCSTNGEHIANARVQDIELSGLSIQRLLFPSAEIFRSKIDGPYNIFSIKLFKGEELVDTLWDSCTTAAYSYRDFADGSETIFADTGSFRREADLVGADGLCDALNFSFAVTNLAPSDAEYVARIYLCGTNDELVCSSTKNVVLSNEINMVNVPFRGIDVKKRDVEGPYYVNEVAIEDAESGEVVERFKPAQILVDRMLSEFGDSPVALNGEATIAEGTGAGTFVVNVPVSAVRPGVVRASAVLVATNGTPVVSAEASREFAAGENGVFTLSFNAADINATGVRGPYEVKYLCLSTDYEGTDEVHLDDLGLGELVSEFVLYVDASKVDDSGDGFTPATAKATIQGAIKVAQPFDTILVADGIYEPIWCGAPGVTIRSMNGPANAIIDGEGQARCVELWAAGTEYYDEEDDEWYYVEPIGGKPVIEGFTLRNGWARGAGAGIYDGTARNCIITGCRSVSDGGGALDATLENCVICGNLADGAGGGAYHCELYGCTVSANKAANGAGGVAHSKVYNSIVHGNTGANEETSEHDYYDGEGGDSTFDYSCTFPLPPSGEGNIAADPLLVDPIHGDVRLRSASPCIDAASPDIDHCDLDIYGHPRVQGESPEMGAVEGCFEDRICVSASVRGIGTVTPQSAFVEAGGSVTFTASSDVREFLAFEVDGKRVSASPVFTLDGIKEDMSITAVFKTGTYYVKADGSDENSGLDWDHAKATIQGALDVCEDGETIYVESGVYAPFDSDDRPVTIRSMLGAAETVIDAGGIGCCAFMGGGLRETNTVLIGFTLQNGVVSGAGGGARGGTLVDCRIINNRAGESGGGLYYSVASRCIISNNMVVADEAHFASYAYDDYDDEFLECYGGGCSRTALYNCLVNNNVVDARAVIGCRGAGGGTYNGSLYNCTVTGNSVLTASSDEEDGDDDDDGNGSVPYARGGGSAFDGAYNTIIWGNTVNGLTENVYDVFTNDCLEDGVDPMFVEGGFALSQGSPCIDAGNEVHVSGGMDVMGNKRVVGDGVDIGAYEYSADVETMFYEVVFMPNGGEGNMESLTCAFGERQSLPTNEFVLAGHVFMGWSLSDVGEVVYRDGEEIFNLASHAGGRVELYANWSQNGNSGPGTIFLTAEVVNGGGLMKVRVQRVGGNEGRVAVKLKTQDASTVGGINGRSGVDFDYFKEFLVWNDGDMSDRVVYIQTHATDATSATTFRLKLSVLTTGDYADCVTPTLASGGKVIATITPAKKGTIAIVEPDPLEVVAGEYLRVKVRRTGGSDGRVAVKLKTQDSATVGGINGVSGRDFQYVKEYLVWEDGDASDRLVEIPTVAAWWSGEPKTFRLKLSVQTSGAFAGCGTPALASNGKVIASIYPNEEAYPGAVGVTKVETVNCCAIRMDGPVVEPPWWGYAGDTLRVTVSRVGGSFGRVAVKAKTQDSATVGGINGVSGRDFQYVKEYLVWEDGEDGDKTMEIPTAIVDGVDYPRTFRLKLSALTTGDYEGCETPELPEPKVVIGLME